MSEQSESPSRRDSLLLALEVAVVGTLAVLLYPVALFLRPRRQTASGAQEVVAPYTVDGLKPDAKGNWPAPFNFGGKPCLVIRTRDGDVRAFNAVCTHVDCTVEFRADKEEIICNCHNGVYDLNGKNVSGPPPRPLELYRVALRGPAGKEEIVVSRNS
jgi:Rieske Fe-S protein